MSPLIQSNIDRTYGQLEIEKIGPFTLRNTTKSGQQSLPSFYM
jgi:hypothetical protein